MPLRQETDMDCFTYPLRSLPRYNVDCPLSTFSTSFCKGYRIIGGGAGETPLSQAKDACPGSNCAYNRGLPTYQKSRMLPRIVLHSAFLVALFVTAASAARAETEAYPSMAPLEQYLMPEADEIAFARSAAPKSISDTAEVMVLKKDGYATAVKGTNGFVCFVERGWAGPTVDFPDFWNPKQRAPNCFNAQAAKTFAQVYLLKTRLVLAGKSKREILQATDAAFARKQLLPPAPGAMCYMMSRDQYLNDRDKSWHPHLMFLVPGDVAKNWGANLDGSPLMAANDPEEHATIFMMVADHWSDGTPAPAMSH